MTSKELPQNSAKQNLVDDLLKNREQRTQKVLELVKNSNVVTIHANLPGINKNLPEARLIVNYFSKQIVSQFGGNLQYFDGLDGLCGIVTDTKATKIDTVNIEETHKLGRLVDIDVFSKGKSHSESRGTLRKCYICGESAAICGRTHKHTTDELTSYFTNSVREYFSLLLGDVFKRSMMYELNLENKFGLVTPTSNGSHKDLTYNLMCKAQDEIIPFITQMFWVGVESTNEQNLLSSIRQLGIDAENKMLLATNGANAYKGLIYILGIVASASGYAIVNRQNTFETVKTMCVNELDGLQEGSTFGVKAYKTYGITGARGHTKSGLNMVANAENLLDDLSSENLLKTLTYIVGNIEDTVLLKRSGSLERYNYFKEKIAKIDINNKKELQKLNNECIANNISIGGSADVLVASITCKLLSEYFDVNTTR